jgi:hypothetical protein
MDFRPFSSTNCDRASIFNVLLLVDKRAIFFEVAIAFCPMIQQRSPKLKIELYFITLASEFQRISPR